MQRVKSVGKGDSSSRATTQDSAKAERRELPVAALLTEAEAVGIHLTVEGECLRIRGPRPAEALGRLLLERKAEVLAILASGPQPVVPVRPTDPPAACGVSTCADPAAWDAERASALVAEVDAHIDAALHDNAVAWTRQLPPPHQPLQRAAGLARRLGAAALVLLGLVPWRRQLLR